MRKIKVIFKNIKNYTGNKIYKARFIYTKLLEKEEIDNNSILFESFVGTNFNGNPFYLLKEVCNNKEYEKFKKYVSINTANEEEATKLLKKYNLFDKVTILKRHSREYCKILATAKYLINNVTFPTYFMRREEQIYLNTWHGTPLKGLGRNVKDKPNSIGNVQRNFIHATHLLFPNDFTFEKIRKDYMLDNLFFGKYIKCGYPRNDILFNEKRKNELKEKLSLQDKKIVIYMPTWREKDYTKKNDKQLYYIMHALYEFEKNLSEDTVVFVKLHHLANKYINFDDFNKVRMFPEGYETYDVLNLADKLITDYSSVMFDYLNTQKEILLYQYDEEEYSNTRSMYMNTKDLPFYSSDNIIEICNEINSEEKVISYLDAREKYCKYDCINSAKKICDYIFKGKIAQEKFEVINYDKFNNKKKNILIFAGSLQKNGITSALRALLNNIDLDKNNYFLTFYNNSTKKHVDFINNLDTRVGYIPIMGTKNYKRLEAISNYFYYRLNSNNRLIEKKLDNLYKREKWRLYRNIKFDTVIHYTGYERQIIHLFKQFEANRVIYTHSDLLKERKTRNNIHLNSLKYAYNKFDHIAIIREGMEKEISQNIKNTDVQKIKLAHNINDIEYIKLKSKEKIMFDQVTESTITVEELKDILNGDAIKFINIARFSPEKGLDILINAFNKYHKENHNSYLIIIGGHGIDYDKIKNMAIETNKNIIIIKSLSNPYAILNKCNCFVLSSHYEGLPMTIMEALILEKKIICTNITGPKEFLSKGYGYLVEKTPEGIYQGMKEYEKNQLNHLKKFDAYEFNEKAIKEFYELIK